MFQTHTRAMDFEPFSFRINDNALPELLEGYKPEAKKPGRPEEEKFDPYGISRTAAPNRIGKLFSD